MIRGRRIAPGMPLRAATALVAAMVLGACDTGVNMPDLVREPEIAGEIAAREFIDGSVAAIQTVDGDQVRIDLNRTTRIEGSTDADEGDLLLYGTEPDGPWFWSGPLLDDPVTDRKCAGIVGRALDEGDSIVFEIGLRLTEAPDFDPAEIRDGEFTDPVREFCIDQHGEVTRYGV